MASSNRSPDAPIERVPVLIVGAGPVGLTLALELERQGVGALLVERNLTTTQHPKMDITNGRSMELYRQLGVADDLRKVAVAGDQATTVTWVTKLTEWELTRFDYPSVDERYREIRSRNDGTLPLEPDMRVSQVLLEPALKGLLESRASHVRVQYGWALDSFTQDADGIDAVLRGPAEGQVLRVRAQYLAGCDGAGSRIRNALGIGLDEVDLRGLIVRELGLVKTAETLIRAFLSRRERPMDGRFYLVHFRSTDRDLLARFGNAWHVQAPEGWTLISQDNRDTWTLHAPLQISADADAIDPRSFVFERLGRAFDCEVLVANAWTPRLTVADRYGDGRVWLAGDAVHQVTPAGGYGMNTGVGDAVGLGWALAAVLHGWGHPDLLRAYELERRSVALRNRTASARHSVVRGAIKAAHTAGIHHEGWNGPRSRRRLAREIADLGNLENEALGIELDYRYDRSPAICGEPGTPPAQTLDTYIPNTWPGSRPPAVHLADGRALFDLFGSGFTLLRFTSADTEPLVHAARDRGVPLGVVDVADAHVHRLYQRDLVLIRPDQHVAWRGNALPDDPLGLIDRVRGGRFHDKETP